MIFGGEGQGAAAPAVPSPTVIIFHSFPATPASSKVAISR